MTKRFIFLPILTLSLSGCEALIEPRTFEVEGWVLTDQPGGEAPLKGAKISSGNREAVIDAGGRFQQSEGTSR